MELVPPDLRNRGFDTPQLYLVEGHGCIYNTPLPNVTQITRVPEGVIWIETTQCGLASISRYVHSFLKQEVIDLLLRMPLPKSGPDFMKDVSNYKTELDKISLYHPRVKFPGEMIGNGRNTLNLIYPGNKISPSGIQHILLPPHEKNKHVANSKFLTQEDIYFMYRDSIYPTKELAWELYQRGDIKNLTFNFDAWFEKMSGPNLHPHIIIIHGGCREDCKKGSEELRIGPPSRLRALSFSQQHANINTRSLNALLIVKPSKSTILSELLKSGNWVGANKFMSRLKDVNPDILTDYINIIPYDGVTALEHANQHPIEDELKKDFIALLKAKGAEEPTIIGKTKYLWSSLLENIENIDICIILLDAFFKITLESEEAKYEINKEENLSTLLYILEKYAPYMEVSNEVALLFSIIAKDVPRSIIAQLLGLVVKYMDNRNLCFKISYIIKNISHINKDIIIAENGIPILIALLRMYSHDADICNEISNFLLILSTNDEGKERIVAVGAVPLLIHILSVHTENKAIVIQVITVLAHLSSLPECITAVIAANGVPVLIACLLSDRDNQDLVVRVSTILAIVSSLPEGRPAFIATRSIPELLHILLSYITNKDIVLQVSTILAYTTSLPESRTAIMTAPGAIALCVAFQTYIKDYFICTVICLAFMHLATDDEGKSFILKNRVISILVEALKIHITHVDVCGKISDTFAKLSTIEAGKFAIVAAGGIPALVDALRMHITDREVSRLGTMVFLNIPEDHSDILAAGGVPVLVRTLGVNMEDIEICRLVTTLFANMIAVAGAPGVVLSSGGISQLNSTLGRHIADRDICSAVSKIFATITVSAEGKTAVFPSVPLLIEALRMHTDIKTNIIQIFHELYSSHGAMIQIDKLLKAALSATTVPLEQKTLTEVITNLDQHPEWLKCIKNGFNRLLCRRGGTRRRHRREKKHSRKYKKRQ